MIAIVMAAARRRLPRREPPEPSRRSRLPQLFGRSKLRSHETGMPGRQSFGSEGLGSSSVIARTWMRASGCAGRLTIATPPIGSILEAGRRRPSLRVLGRRCEGRRLDPGRRLNIRPASQLCLRPKDLFRLEALVSPPLNGRPRATCKALGATFRQLPTRRKWHARLQLLARPRPQALRGASGNAPQMHSLRCWQSACRAPSAPRAEGATLACCS